MYATFIILVETFTAMQLFYLTIILLQAIKFPEKAFIFLLHVIGRQYDDPIVQQYRKRFPYYENVLVKDEERGTVLFKENE